MLKKFFYLYCFLLLTNCSAPGTVLLGPIFTGAKTGSIYQASLSYSTGKIMNEVKQNEFFLKSDPIIVEKSLINKNPLILSSYVVEKIEVSSILEPEPLP